MTLIQEMWCKMTDNNFQIKRTFIKDEAYHILEKEIISGKLKPNTRININEISERLGISRTPVREAILRLENEGLVISKPNQWTIVAPIDLSDVVDIYPLISVLEAYALRDGFKNVDQVFIDTLTEINEDIKISFDNHELVHLISLDNEFHRMIINLSSNNAILPIITDLKKRLIRIEMYYFENLENRFSSYDEHKEIIKFLREDNLDKAEEALKANWINTLNSIDIE